MAPLKNYKTRTLVGVGGGQQAGGLTSPPNDSDIHRHLLPTNLNQQIVWPGEGPRLVLTRNKWETSSSSGFLRPGSPGHPYPKQNTTVFSSSQKLGGWEKAGIFPFSTLGLVPVLPTFPTCLGFTKGCIGLGQPGRGCASLGGGQETKDPDPLSLGNLTICLWLLFKWKET